MKKKLRVCHNMSQTCVWCSLRCQVGYSLQPPFDDNSCSSWQRWSQTLMHKNMKSYSEVRNRIAKSEFGVNFHSVLFGERAGWRRYPARASYSLEKEERERASILLAATVNAGIQTPDWVRRFFSDSSDASAQRAFCRSRKGEGKCIFTRTLRCKWCYCKLKSWK